MAHPLIDPLPRVNVKLDGALPYTNETQPMARVSYTSSTQGATVPLPMARESYTSSTHGQSIPYLG